jgi:hypothetical protein
MLFITTLYCEQQRRRMCFPGASAAQCQVLCRFDEAVPQEARRQGLAAAHCGSTQTDAPLSPLLAVRPTKGVDILREAAHENVQ